MSINDLFGPVAANDNQRKCLVCDEPITGRATKRYCGKACRRKAESQNRDRDAENKLRLLAALESSCEQCGVAFKGIAKDGKPLRFCSRACGARSTKEENTFKSTVTKASKYGHGIKPASYTVYRPLCAVCGLRFTSVQSTALYCSDECSNVEVLKRQAERYYDENDTDRGPRPCVECGTIFAPEYGISTRRSYCSDACLKRKARRVAKGIRNARLRGVGAESVNAIAVFERDGWLCQICGIDTPRDKRGSYDNDAPELDHIIPLAKGGAHTYANVQCSCRECNARKSDSLPVSA